MPARAMAWYRRVSNSRSSWFALKAGPLRRCTVDGEVTGPLSDAFRALRACRAPQEGRCWLLSLPDRQDTNTTASGTLKPDGHAAAVVSARSDPMHAGLVVFVRSVPRPMAPGAAFWFP